MRILATKDRHLYSHEQRDEQRRTAGREEIITDKNGYLTNPFSILLGQERTVFISYSTVNDTVTSDILIDLETYIIHVISQ